MNKKMVGDKELKWKVLYQSIPSERVEKLIELYKKDKKKARVYFHQTGRKAFFSNSTVLFEDPNGDFRISWIKKTYGISINSKMYSSERVMKSIIYSKKKFWFKSSNKEFNPLTIRPLCFTNLYHFCNMYDKLDCGKGVENKDNDTYQYILSKIPWLRFIMEHEYFHNVSLNTIINHKLYNHNDLLKHLYKAPLPTCKVVLEHYINWSGGISFTDHLSIWKETKKNLINIENLRIEMLRNKLFRDTSFMASKLGEKINCSWSDKRLKAEHDKWSDEITKIIIELEEERDLNPHEIYKRFAEFTGYKLLQTNRDLIGEGVKMRHCVATYQDYVRSGRSGIYQANGYTLELGKQTLDFDVRPDRKIAFESLSIRQYQNVRNTPVPDIYVNEVKVFVGKFNQMLLSEAIEKEVFKSDFPPKEIEGPLEDFLKKEFEPEYKKCLKQEIQPWDIRDIEEIF